MSLHETWRAAVAAGDPRSFADYIREENPAPAAPEAPEAAPEAPAPATIPDESYNCYDCKTNKCLVRR